MILKANKSQTFMCHRGEVSLKRLDRIWPLLILFVATVAM